MPVAIPPTCTKGALADASGCLICLPAPQQLAIQTYLLTVLAGVAADKDVLITNSKCFLCLEPKQLLAIQAYLLCQIVNA